MGALTPGGIFALFCGRPGVKRGTAMRHFISLLCCLSLVGCIELDEEITIHGDGSGKAVFELSLNEKMVKLASFAQESGTFFDRNAIEAQLKASENVEHYDIREKTEDGTRRTTFDMTLKDMTVDMEGLGKFASDDVKDRLDVGDKRAEDPPFTVRRLENGNFKFVQSISGGQKIESNPLLSGIMSGKYMRVKLIGKVVSANGTIAEDKQSVSWEIPIAQLMSGTTTLKALEAEIEGARPGSAIAVLTTIVVVFGIVLVGLVILRRRLLS